MMEQISPLNSINGSDVKKMLNDLFGIFLNKFKETQKAWDNLIEFIAIDNSGELYFYFEHSIRWLYSDKRFRDQVYSVYDSNLLKSEYYDHLGDFYYEYVKKKPFKQNLPIINENQIRAKNIEKNEPLKIFDSNIGTGKNILAIHKLIPEAIIFGVASDLDQYKIALVNSLIFEIKCYLLCMDKKNQNFDLKNREGVENWKNSNLWKNNFNVLAQKSDKLCS